MQAILLISLGASVGANARYFISRHAARLSPTMPYGTFFINVSGSLLVGFFLVWTTERVLADPRWRYLVAIGFCGSFTTFSSYAYESFALFEQGHWRLVAANVALNNLLALAAVVAGAVLARVL